MNQSPFEAEYKKPIDWREENTGLKNKNNDWRKEAAIPDEKVEYLFSTKEDVQKELQ